MNEKQRPVNHVLSKCCSAKCSIHVDKMCYICSKCKKRCLV